MAKSSLLLKKKPTNRSLKRQLTKRESKHTSNQTNKETNERKIKKNNKNTKQTKSLKGMESFLKTLIGAQVLNKLPSLYETKGS